MLVKINSTGYVIAFFEIIKEKDRFQATHNQIIELREIVNLNKELLLFLGDKNTPLNDKFKFVDEVFVTFTRDIINLLKVMTERNSISILDTVLKQYLVMSNKELNILYAEVTTAYPLSLLEITKLKFKLEKMYKKKIELKNKINENLISGFQIRIGSDIIEQNVDNDLDRIKNYILKEEGV